MAAARGLFARLLEAVAKSEADLLEALVRVFAKETSTPVSSVAPKDLERILTAFKEHAKSGRAKDVEDVLVELISKDGGGLLAALRHLATALRDDWLDRTIAEAAAAASAARGASRGEDASGRRRGAPSGASGGGGGGSRRGSSAGRGSDALERTLDGPDLRALVGSGGGGGGLGGAGAWESPGRARAGGAGGVLPMDPSTIREGGKVMLRWGGWCPAHVRVRVRPRAEGSGARVSLSGGGFGEEEEAFVVEGWSGGGRGVGAEAGEASAAVLAGAPIVLRSSASGRVLGVAEGEELLSLRGAHARARTDVWELVPLSAMAASASTASDGGASATSAALDALTMSRGVRARLIPIESSMQCVVRHAATGALLRAHPESLALFVQPLSASSPSASVPHAARPAPPGFEDVSEPRPVAATAVPHLPDAATWHVVLAHSSFAPDWLRALASPADLAGAPDDLLAPPHQPPPPQPSVPFTSLSPHAQEALLLDEVLAALQGVPGLHIVPDTLPASSAWPRESVRWVVKGTGSRAGLAAVAERILPVADACGRCRTAIQILGRPEAGSVAQALAEAARAVVGEFDVLVGQMETLARAALPHAPRHHHSHRAHATPPTARARSGSGSGSDGGREAEEGRTAVAPVPPMGLERVLYMVQPSLRALSVLEQALAAGVCGVRGTRLVSRVFRLWERCGDEAARAVLLFVLERCSAPLLARLHAWLYLGQWGASGEDADGGARRASSAPEEDADDWNPDVDDDVDRDDQDDGEGESEGDVDGDGEGDDEGDVDGLLQDELGVGEGSDSGDEDGGATRRRRRRRRRRTEGGRGTVAEVDEDFFIVRFRGPRTTRGSLATDAASEHWEGRFRLDVEHADAIPPFLAPHAARILDTGRCVDAMRHCSAEGSWDAPESDAPLEFSTDARAFEARIASAHAFATRALAQHLLQRAGLLDALRWMRDVFLLRQGDFVTHLLDSAHAELARDVDLSGRAPGAAPLLAPRLRALVDLALRATSSSALSADDAADAASASSAPAWAPSAASAARWRPRVASVLEPRSLAEVLRGLYPEAAAAVGGVSGSEATGKRQRVFSHLSLAARARWPLTLLLDRRSVLKYQVLFRHLFFVRYVERRLCESWHAHQMSKELDLGPELSTSWALRQRMLHCVHNVLFHMTVEVIEPAWHALEEALAASESVDEMRAAHSAFLDTCLVGCMLSRADVLKPLSKLVTLCLYFATRLVDDVTKHREDAELAVPRAQGAAAVAEAAAAAAAATERRGGGGRSSSQRAEREAGIRLRMAALRSRQRQERLQKQAQAMREQMQDPSWRETIQRSVDMFNKFLQQLFESLTTACGGDTRSPIAHLLARLDSNNFYSRSSALHSRRLPTVAAPPPPP